MVPRALPATELRLSNTVRRSRRPRQPTSPARWRPASEPRRSRSSSAEERRTAGEARLRPVNAVRADPGCKRWIGRDEQHEAALPAQARAEERRPRSVAPTKWR